MCADALFEVAETDEINNCLADTFKVTAPDLRVQPLGFEPASLFEEGFVGFKSLIENRGDKKAGPSSARFRIDVGNNGTWDISINAPAGAVDVGQSESKEWAPNWSAALGTHRYEICADVNSEISESNENNNCVVFQFNVQKKIDPDLVFESTGIEPTSPAGGQSITFWAIVKNLGTRSGAFTNELTIDVRNDGVRDKLPLRLTDVSSLGFNETFRLEWRGAWTAEPGTHKYEMCADLGLVVMESNENNNCVSGIFTVQ